MKQTAKKLTVYCIASFILGAFVFGWFVLILSRSTSEVWVTNYVIQMASQFELDARSEYSKENRVRARDLMNSAFLIRLHLASSGYPTVWSMDMPLSSAIGKSLIASMNPAENAEDLMFLYDCAVLVLSKDSTEADSRFYSIKKRFQHVTREKCIGLGEAFLGNPNSMDSSLIKKGH